MKGYGYFGTFIGGALVGAALGLILAPEKGADTREKLSKERTDYVLRILRNIYS